MDQNKRIVVAIVIVALLGAAATASLYYLSSMRGVSTSTSSTSFNGYPAGCTKPAGGFLIIASHLGWNDSELHGAGVTAGVVWPIMNITQGSTVNITVCNTDIQAHSFNVEYYLSQPVNTIHPGQVLHFSFVATQAGTFQVYCEIPCSIHIYMISGQLRVLPS